VNWVEQLCEPRLVGVTHAGFAIWLNRFGMLYPQVIVNLLPEFGVGADFVNHGNWLGRGFRCAAGTSQQTLLPNNNVAHRHDPAWFYARSRYRAFFHGSWSKKSRFKNFGWAM